MSKLILDNVQGGYNLQKINSNFEKIETALNTQVLYRQNPEGEDNAVKQDIDMDGNDLINVGDVQINGYGSFVEAIEDVEQARDDAEGFAQQAANSASQSASSALASSNSASQAAASAQQVEDAKLIWRGAWDSLTAYDVNDAVENDGTSYICILAHTNEEPPNASHWDVLAMRGADGAAGEGTGDVSSNTATSVDNEIALFSGTSGKIIKRAVSTGILKATSGVLSTAVGGTDYLRPSDFGIGVTGQAPFLPDLDAIDTPVGFYRAGGSSTANIASRPAGAGPNAIVLLERYDANDLRQTYAPRGDHASAGRVFFREYDSVGGVWHEWKEVITDANIKTINGQSLLGPGDIAIAAGWKHHIISASGTFAVTAGKEYFVVAVGAGGSGAATRYTGLVCSSGGGGGGVVAKSVIPEASGSLTITVGAGGGRLLRTNNGTTNGLAGGNTVVSGGGAGTMTAGGGGGGVGRTSNGTSVGGAGGTASGGDFNYPGGSAGDVSISTGNVGATGGGSLFGSGSLSTVGIQVSSGATMSSPGEFLGDYGLASVNYVPASVDYLTRIALMAISSGAGVASDGTISSSETVWGKDAGLGAGSGGAASMSTLGHAYSGAGGDGIVIILEKL